MLDLAGAPVILRYPICSISDHAPHDFALANGKQFDQLEKCGKPVRCNCHGYARVVCVAWWPHPKTKRSEHGFKVTNGQSMIKPGRK